MTLLTAAQHSETEVCSPIAVDRHDLTDSCTAQWKRSV